MKAARIHGYNEPILVEQIEIPVIKDPDGVLVKISGSGFCHSDLRIIIGERKAPFDFPYVMGHENSGIVCDVGPNASGLRKGDSVLVYGAWGCRNCNICLSGEEQLCDNPTWPGVSQRYQGGFAEYLYVPSQKYLIRVDEKDPTILAPLTDAALTAYRATKKSKQIRPAASQSMVIGVGGLGVYAVQFLKLLTKSTVIALDAVEQKLKLAEELGADHARLAQSANYGEIMRLTGGRGVDTVLDFVSNKSTVDLSLKVLGKQGTYIAVGLGGGSLDLATASFIRSELTVTGSRWGSYEELKEVYQLYREGKLRVLSQKRNLEEINDVVEEMKRAQIPGRVVLVP